MSLILNWIKIIEKNVWLLFLNWNYPKPYLNKFYFYSSVGGLMVEKPKLDSNSKVIGWDVSWSPQRPFALGKKMPLKSRIISL